MKTICFLLVCFLLVVSDVFAGTQKVNPAKGGLPIIRIETDTEILLYEAAPSTYKLPWNPMDPADALQILNVHNQVRKDLGLNLLKWSYKLEQSAWFWNRNCVPVHDPNLPLNVGENIVSVTSSKVLPSDFIIGGTEQWLSEIATYVCDTDSCTTAPSGKSEVCGHFVQAIWNDTTHVGCALVKCSENSPFASLDGSPDNSWLQTVCRYYPPAYEGLRPVPKTACKTIAAHSKAGAFKGVPKISTGKGPMGPLPSADTVAEQISTGAVRVIPK